jgi:NTP pyrophosphatase (non-canonical NTP hydrolase)
MSIGQIAYEHFRLGGTIGLTTLVWDELNPEMQMRWEAAAVGVLNAADLDVEGHIAPDEFILACVRNHSPRSDLNQMVMGLNSEAGEVAGLLEKMVYQGHTFDRSKWTKELGDVLWYFSGILHFLDFSYEEVMIANREKLAARYQSGGFTTEESVRRVDE